MTIAKAVERLTWRFSSGQSFKPNQLDLKSWNEIVEWMNEAREAKLDNNIGFAKLYIFVFAHFCKQYNATPLDAIPQKELHSLLSKPLDLFVRSFTNHLNQQEQEDLMVEAGYVEKESMFATPEEIKARAARMTELIKIPENRERFLGNSWEEATVKENLLLQATEALIKFKL